MAARPLVAALAAAAALAPAATAHVDVQPGLAEPGTEQLLTFTVPNDEGVEVVTGFSVALPRGSALLGVEAKPGWAAKSSGLMVRWSGGRIAKREFATFSLRLRVPERIGTVGFESSTLYANGSELRVPLSLFVRPAVQAATPAGARDEGARTLGKAALAVALAAGALALGGGFLGLWLWLRRPD